MDYKGEINSLCFVTLKYNERLEGASTGPKSFTISAAGEIYVLDQVNSRVLKFRDDGSPESQFPLPDGAYEDIDVTQDGKLILLDRFRRKSLIVLDENGKEKAVFGIAGRGIKQLGGIGPMVLCKNGLYLDSDHSDSESHLVHLLDGALQPAERKIIPGNKISRDCKKAVDFDLPWGSDNVVLKPIDIETGGKLAENVISLEGKENCYIACLEAEHNNKIHLILCSSKENLTDADRHVPNEIYTYLTLDKNLKEINKVTFTSPEDRIYLADEPFRSFRIAHRGETYFMNYTEKGLKLLRWRTRNQ